MKNFATYGWVITADLLGDERSDVGTVGPSGCPFSAEHIERDGSKFRMKDDDGEVYYEGRIILGEDEEWFGPLDDFGMPNAGCTSIEYYNEHKSEWEVI